MKHGNGEEGGEGEEEQEEEERERRKEKKGSFSNFVTEKNPSFRLCCFNLSCCDSLNKPLSHPLQSLTLIPSSASLSFVQKTLICSPFFCAANPNNFISSATEYDSDTAIPQAHELRELDEFSLPLLAVFFKRWPFSAPSLFIDRLGTRQVLVRAPNRAPEIGSVHASASLLQQTA